MQLLFDQGTPAPLRHLLIGHEVSTSHERGWGQEGNGRLLQLAEPLFDGLITTDQNLQYQQNLTGRRLWILVLPTTSWPRIRRNAAAVVEAVGAMKPGEFRQLTFSE